MVPLIQVLVTGGEAVNLFHASCTADTYTYIPSTTHTHKHKHTIYKYTNTHRTHTALATTCLMYVYNYMYLRGYKEAKHCNKDMTKKKIVLTKDMGDQLLTIDPKNVCGHNVTIGPQNV